MRTPHNVRYAQHTIASQRRLKHVLYMDQARASAPSFLVPPPVRRVVASRVATRPVMDGAAQEAASRAIGQELALIGVPAPTTLDGFRPAKPDEVKTFLVSSGLEEQQATDVAKALKDELNISSIVQYGWWFADESLKDWFKTHQAWRQDASLFVALKWALATCGAMDKAKEKHKRPSTKMIRSRWIRCLKRA